MLGVLGATCPGCDDDVHATPFAEEDGGDPPDSGPEREGGGDPQTGWEMVFEDREAALFSIWGTTGDDVWTVGSDTGDGPLVMHYDGEHWEPKDTGASGDLWWVSGQGQNVWMSGAEGLVLRYSTADDSFEEFSMPDPITVFGIYPIAEDDVWAVGGGFAGGLAQAIYHFDGDEWIEVNVPETEGEQPFFKVWGRSSDDLWVVGFGSEALHRVDGEWEVVPVPTGQRLFTVHGNDDYVAAVGGTIVGFLVEEDGGVLENVTPAGIPQLNGIWVADDGTALAGGTGGFLYERVDGQWQEVEDAPLAAWDYHAVFIDDDGGQWAVGGLVVAPPYTAGMLAHRGAQVTTEGVPD